ncbi:YeeE/YedE family protein [Nannocystaceae bacterium ST9]
MPLASLIGGALIGLSAALLLIFNGRIAGISGIFGGLLEGLSSRSGPDATPAPELRWRALFVGGLLLGGLILRLLDARYLPGPAVDSWITLAIAGGLVGFGTRLGSGCTSGHGICGLSRLSTRSLAATGTFMATAIATTFVIRHLIGVQG